MRDRRPYRPGCTPFVQPVMGLTGGYRPCCTCSWRGQTHPLLDPAEQQAIKHAKGSLPTSEASP